MCLTVRRALIAVAVTLAVAAAGCSSDEEAAPSTPAETGVTDIDGSDTGTPPTTGVPEDAVAVEAWVDEAIADNPGPVEQFRGGKEGALNAVLGQVMKKSGGSANPKAVRELLLQRLSGS